MIHAIAELLRQIHAGFTTQDAQGRIVGQKQRQHTAALPEPSSIVKTSPPTGL